MSDLDAAIRTFQEHTTQAVICKYNKTGDGCMNRNCTYAHPKLSICSKTHATPQERQACRDAHPPPPQARDEQPDAGAGRTFTSRPIGRNRFPTMLTRPQGRSGLSTNMPMNNMS